MFFLLILCNVFPLVFSQSNSDNVLQIEAIKAHFSAAGIVPSLLSTFSPSAVLDANYPGVGKISPGQALTRSQAAFTPDITVDPWNSTVSLSGNFTLAMVDAGPVGTDESHGVTRHWLVNGVIINGSSVSNSSATAITQYAGPAPPTGSGPHRYVIILYTQPSTFSPPAEFSQPNIGVSVFDLNAYAKNSGLGDIVGATYLTVEEGQATVSLSATTPVATSTLGLPSLSSASDFGTPGSSSVAPTQSQPNGAQALILSPYFLPLLVAHLVI